MLKNQVIEEADKPNRNNRIYPESVLMSVAEQVNQRVEHGIPVMGELGQPSGELEGGTVHMEKVSHRVSNARVVKGGLMVDVAVMNTPMGKVLKGVLDKEPVRFAMRAFTDFSEPDANGVRTAKSVQLVTFDAVSP